MFHNTVILMVVLILTNTRTNGQSSEDHQAYAYSNFYAPSTLNFNDIYANNIAMLAEEPILASSKEDAKDFHLQNLPTQFVEFRPATEAVVTTTVPPPKYILNSKYIDKDGNETERLKSTSTSTTTTTEEPDDFPIKVIPIKKNYQRGVLDLLFPASRVRTFKSVFDTFRRILSHTFKK